MKLPVYYINAFTDRLFHGNPAAVCILSKWLSDELLHAIARENNLPVTVFLVRDHNKFSIRWITPEYELDLCGHGTLAAGFVIFNFFNPLLQKVELHSRSEILQITRKDDFISLNFPTKSIESCSLPLLIKGLGLEPQEIYQHKNERCLAVFRSEDEVRLLKPNMQFLRELAHRGVIVTAAGKNVDFVSRTFYPQKNISEDPVTGASHCLLVPYWSHKLKKKILHAHQVSERGGEIDCQMEGDRILLSGKALLYMQGLIMCRPL